MQIDTDNITSTKEVVELVATLHRVQSEGKLTTGGGVVRSGDSYAFNAAPAYYGFRPKPAFRPWTVDEVPVGAVVCLHKSKVRELIVSCDPDRGDGAIVEISSTYLPPSQVLGGYVMADGSPCGVEVMEED